MKKIIITFSIILFAGITFGQGYFGIGAGKGASMFAGFAAEKVQIQYNIQIPFKKASLPLVNAVTVGYNIGSNIVVTPLAGLAFYSKKDFTEYSRGGSLVVENGIEYYRGGEIITERGIKPIYGMEISKTWYMGRLFAYGNNYGYGIGIKCVFVN